MVYYGGYPEPVNDPEFDKNSDDFTWRNMLQLIVIMIAAFVLMLIICSPVIHKYDTEENVADYIVMLVIYHKYGV